MTICFAFLDPACQELDLNHHCYKFDPYCPPKIFIKTRDNFTTTSILALFLGVVIPIAVLIVLFCYFRQKQRRRYTYGKLNYTTIKKGSRNFLSVTFTHNMDVSHPVKICDVRTHLEKLLTLKKKLNYELMVDSYV